MNIDKSALAITVEGEKCAGAGAVAAELARLLKLKCFSDEILTEASRLSGIPEKLLRRYEEKRVRQAYDLAAESEDALRIPPERTFLAAQAAACQHIAGQGPCVLVDHHSNAALSDRADHIGIFVHANFADRLGAYAREHGLLPAQAQRRFAREDRERTRCFRALSRNWGRASSYCLTVNASRAEPEALAQHIVRYLETVTQEELVHPTLAPERSA